MPKRLIPMLLLGASLVLGQARAATSAAEFDRQFRRLDDNEVSLVGQAQATAALERLRAALPAHDDQRARRFRTVECVLAFEDDSAGALAFAKAGLADARRAHDVDAEARFEACRGFRLESLDSAAALRTYENALQLARRSEDPRLIGDALTYRGGILSLQGQQALALQDLLQAQAVFERARLAQRSESNLLNIGTTYRRMGLYAQALHYFAQSEAYARRTNNEVDLLSVYMQRGYAYEEQHQAQPALHEFNRALEIAHRSGRIDEGYAHIGLAHAWLAAGDAKRALDAHALAARELDIDHTGENEPMLDEVEGQALALQGRPRAAIAAFDRAEPLIRRQGDVRYLTELHASRAASYEALGDYRNALADLRAYGQLTQRLRDDAEDQRTSVWRMQFDASRRAVEGERLQMERRKREEQIRALERARPWRWAVLGLGALLVGSLAAFAMLQRREAMQLRRLALTDALTGLPNRRRILRLGERELVRARRRAQSFSVVALDLDHFKRINDSHGHGFGDAVLEQVAQALTGGLRRHDVLGRSGGEEFLAILPGTPLDDAMVVAERLRQAVESLAVASKAGVVPVRTSAGVAEAGPADLRLRDLIGRADAALYRSKSAGRNRVTAAH